MHPFHLLLPTASCLASLVLIVPATIYSMILPIDERKFSPAHVALKHPDCIEAIVRLLSPIFLKTHRSFSLRNPPGCNFIHHMLYQISYCRLVTSLSAPLPRLISQISSHLLMSRNEELPLPFVLPHQDANFLRISTRCFEFCLCIEIFE